MIEKYGMPFPGLSCFMARQGWKPNLLGLSFLPRYWSWGRVTMAWEIWDLRPPNACEHFSPFFTQPHMPDEGYPLRPQWKFIAWNLVFSKFYYCIIVGFFFNKNKNWVELDYADSWGSRILYWKHLRFILFSFFFLYFYSQMLSLYLFFPSFFLPFFLSFILFSIFSFHFFLHTTAGKS